MVECPTCGDDSFDTERGMKIHHTRKHGFKLSEFESEQEWVRSDETIEWNDETIDRFAAQVERQIKQTAEMFDLNAR